MIVRCRLPSLGGVPLSGSGLCCPLPVHPPQNRLIGSRT
jgi:hypothetical protein